ncbi:MAG: hypothetical protein Q8862_00675 [Bacteroidota bacterium]|nr:hypothetical protein [Bacteroidota bacterium]
MKKTLKIFVAFLFTVVLLIGFVTSCTESIQYRIPYVVVDKFINLNTTNELLVSGNSKQYAAAPYGGFGGLIVCCLSQGNYVAFDAACPNEATSTAVVKADGLIATCPVCKSKFLLMNGTPISGPCKSSLRPYRVIYGDNTLYVKN